MSMQVSSPLAVSIAEGAKLLGVSVPTMYRMVNRGSVPTMQYPGVAGQKIRVADLEDYVDRCARIADEEDAAVRESIRRDLRMVGSGGGGRRGR
jgi:excisionase family DNA binding protein